MVMMVKQCQNEQREQKELIQQMNMKLLEFNPLKAKMDSVYDYLTEVQKDVKKMWYKIENFGQQPHIKSKGKGPVDPGQLKDYAKAKDLQLTEVEVDRLKIDVEMLLKMAKERDFTDEILGKTSTSDNQVGIVSKGEFLGIKQLISRHQLTLNNLQAGLGTAEKSRDQIEKMEKLVADNFGFLKQYIDENKNMQAQMIAKIQGKLNGKPDFGFFDEFKSNVETKILNKMDMKIDKLDHK